MPLVTDYPISWFSKVVSETAGTSSATQFLLCHGDRALVSGGSVFVDHSSYDHAVFDRGSGIIQIDSLYKFGSSGILFTGSTASVDKARLTWEITAATAITNTTFQWQMQVESFIYFDGEPDPVGAYFFEFSNVSHATYIQSYFWQDVSGVWYMNVTKHSNGSGTILNRNWILGTLTTGTFHHYCVAVKLVSGSSRVGVFQDGSQLPLADVLLVGGTPSTGLGQWSDFVSTMPVDTPNNMYLSLGGLVSAWVPTAANPFNVIGGVMDEVRFLVDTVDGLTDSAMTVPTGPYSPIGGTFNITARTLQLTSAAFLCTTDGGLNLGTSSSQWGDLYVTGTAYIDAVGENMPVLGTVRVSWGSAASAYIYSSANNFLTIVATSQVDIQANLGLSAKNVIIDTVTGVKFGTTTNVKLGFFNATPVVQQSGNIITALSTLGLVTGGSVPGAIPNVTTTSTTYTLLSSDDYLICNSGTAFAVNLPVTIGSYKEFMVKNMGAANVTLTAAAADSIDGGTTVTIAQWTFSKVFDFTAATGIDAYTKLMLDFEEADGSTNFVDTSPYGKTVTAVGNAQIDTAQKKYGNASGLFDGTGDYLTVPDSADWDLGTDDFTIEAFVRLADLADNMICTREESGTSYFYFGFESTTLRLRDYTGADNFDMQRSVSISSVTWYHVAAVREGNVFSLYLDGVRQGATSTAAVTFTARTSLLTVGHLTVNSSYALNGWMDEFRWSKGIARWSADFTPPTGAYTSVSGRWLTIT